MEKTAPMVPPQCPCRHATLESCFASLSLWRSLLSVLVVSHCVLWATGARVRWNKLGSCPEKVHMWRSSFSSARSLSQMKLVACQSCSTEIPAIIGPCSFGAPKAYWIWQAKQASCKPNAVNMKNLHYEVSTLQNIITMRVKAYRTYQVAFTFYTLMVGPHMTLLGWCMPQLFIIFALQDRVQSNFVLYEHDASWKNVIEYCYTRMNMLVSGKWIWGESADDVCNLLVFETIASELELSLFHCLLFPFLSCVSKVLIISVLFL